MQKVKFILLLCLFYNFQANSQMYLPYVLESDTVNNKKIDPAYWQFLPDSNNSFTIDQARNTAYAARFLSAGQYLNKLDFSISTYWIRYAIKNSMPKTANISIASHSEQSEFYIIYPGGKQLYLVNGWLSDWGKRNGFRYIEQVPVSIGPGETITIYNKVYNACNVLKPSMLDVSYMSADKAATIENATIQTHYYDGMRNAILFGSLFIIFLLNLISYFLFKDKTYLYFGLYILTEALVEFQNMRELVFLNHTRLFFNLSLLFYPLQFLFLANFVRYFIRTYTYYPKWDRILFILSFLPLISFIIGFFVTPYISNPGSDLFRHITAACFCLVFISVFFTFLLKNHEQNRTVAMMIKAAIPAIFFWALGFTLYTLFSYLQSWHNIETPFIVEKLESLYPYINKILIFYLSVILSLTMFLRYNNLRKEMTQQMIERERIDKERIIEKERNDLVAAQKLELEKQVAERTLELEKSLQNLKSTQGQLIQSEKMASLGELTAGIAHEIQNPLNFVNNFSEVSIELAEEVKEEINKETITEADKKNIDYLVNCLVDNQQKIAQHGKRADSIVKSMLLHSRKSTGKKEPTDLNELLDEYLRLSYHGIRAKDKSFNAQMVTNFDKEIPKVLIVAQDIGRVALNMFNNAFYSVSEKKKIESPEYKPLVTLATEKIGNRIKIIVTDNGLGIPQKILDKIYQPFFTTKPPGDGTGLGLSLSYDIIKAHDGELEVETKEGEFARFIIIIKPEFC